MSPGIRIRRRRSVPAELQSVDVHVSARSIGPSASAIAKPDRPRQPIGHVRRLLLVQRSGKGDRPVGKRRRSGSVTEEND